MESLQGAYQAVDGDAIGRAYREMESVASYDERLSGIAAGLSDAESILSDICRSISDYMDEMEFSGEDFKRRKNVWILSVELWQNTEIARKLS